MWNRSPEKAASLVEKGAVLAHRIAATIAAKPLVLVCVMNYAAADPVLDDAAPELPGKLLVRFTTRSPQDAWASETCAHEHRAEHLGCAVTGSPAVTFRCCASWIERKGRPGLDSAELLAMDRDQNPVRQTDFELLISPNVRARFSRQISRTLRTQQL